MARKSVLVRNAGHEPILYVTPGHAIRMYIRNVAEFDEVDEKRPFGPFPFPLSMRLVKYQKMDWFFSKPIVWSKSGVLRRDKYKCAYCGGTANTIDHVHPVSRGGKSSWDNTVSACKVCNVKKRDRTPEEAGMPLRWRPFVPQRGQLIIGRRSV